MIRVVASSVRGPAHIREGQLCQDAWFAVPDEGACFAAVSDGLGSRPEARKGARAAVLAARDAWRIWRRSPAGTAEDCLRLVEVIWRLRLQDLAPDSASTTCLFYAEDGRGRALVAQLGDGLIARRNALGKVSPHPSDRRGFGFTQALGTAHRLADWSYSISNALAENEALVLATDGVSDDIEPGRLGDLASWVIEELGPVPNPGRELANELRNWPVPRHQDDKTLLLMWKPCSQSK